MEEFSEQKKVELVAMSIKEDVESDSSPNVEDTKCTMCESTNIFRNYIPTAEVVHCICECGSEWVE